MCNYVTEGNQYACGHYVITRKTGFIDCGRSTCIYSERHPNPCRNCDYHEKFMGPDREERIIGVVNKFCDHCSPYWTPANGASPAARRR